MKRVQGIALLSLVGLFVSLYLLLYAMGFYGALACGPGNACDLVQASPYADFLGLPVAGWGVGWYAAVLALALLALRPAFARRRWPGRALFALAAAGLAFSAYLTGVELFVLEALCTWCVVSAALTGVIFVLALPGARGAERSRET